MRNYASIHGLLDDYAFTISAFTALYQTTFDEKWLYKAKDLNDYAVTHFFDSKRGMFFYTHNKHSNLIARKMEVSDNVISPRPILKWPKFILFWFVFRQCGSTPKIKTDAD
jgi:uncharacterized protein YyaL (SSP411 family)